MPKLFDEKGKDLKIWNSWPGVQISPRREAAQILAGIGNARQWHNIHQNPPRQRGQSNAMARGAGKSSPTFSK